MKFKQLLASTMILGMLSSNVMAAPQTRTITFNDIAGHWSEGYVNEAVEKGMFSGKAEGVFAPEDQITRAEFIVVMLRMIEAPIHETPDGAPWYQSYFEVASEWSLIPSDFTLDSMNTPITREEIATTLVRTVGEYMFEPETENSQELTDYDDISPEHVSYVTQAVKAGLMSGMGDGMFAPAKTATRAEAATVAVTVAKNYFPDRIEFDNELCETYANAIISSRSDEENANILPVSSTTHEMWNILSSQFGISGEQMDAFSVATSMMMVQAYCVAVVKPAEGQEEAIQAGFEKFKEMKISDFTGYLPDQLEYAQNAVIETLADGTMILVMGESAETVYPLLKETLEG